MPSPTTSLERLAKELYKKYASKADVARELLDQGYSVGAISKAVPMAYSQVHSINRKKEIDSRPPGRGEVETPAIRAMTARRSGSWGELPAKTVKTKKPKPSPALTKRVLEAVKNGGVPKVKVSRNTGRLRVPGLPSDIDAGPCANCDFSLVIRKMPTGYTLIHVNISAEEYYSTTQFCQAVPVALIPL